jgi:hypothetical protein
VNSGTQRADVADFYEAVYALLARTAAAIAADRSVPSEMKFLRFKEVLPGAWAALSRRKVNENVGLNELLAAAAECMAQPFTWIHNGQTVAGTLESYHQFVDVFLRDIIVRHAPPECDLVIDLGCGWGHRMFDVWLGGGPRRALYAGGDRPNASRDCIAQIAPFFPSMRVDAFRFDFLNPSFYPLPYDAKDVFVYSVHAIEQIERLGPALFRSLLASYPGARITGVHLEPAMFQLPGAESADPARWRLDRDYAVRWRYNQDLVEQLASNPSIKIQVAEPSGLTVPKGNGTALLVWSN